MAVEAAVPRGPVALPGAQTPAVVCAQAATAVDAAPPTCPGSSDAAANTVPEALGRHRRVALATECVPSQAWRQVWLLPQAVQEAPVVARCAAASPVDVLPVRAGARVAASCPAPRCEAESSVERIVQRVPTAAQETPLRRWAWEALRLSPRQPVVLRFVAARERSRPEVLHRRQQEAVVRLRRRVAASLRLRPVLRRARARRPAAVGERQRSLSSPQVHAA
jgi:hypothetical protein